jgi:eukaryotic-like serine/threonine-protein kinase
MRIGGYEIEARIGRGGMAEVLRGRVVGGPRAGASVAVKRLLPALAHDPAQVALFAREARLAAQLHHPAIVEVLETGVEAGAPYIAMEYVDGRDLARLIAACAARGIRLPLDFALYAAHAVAEALRYAHGARSSDGRPLGVVHCDVSPSNVFVSHAGEVKLGDFGVARAAGEGRGRAAFGKVRYLAPEQLRGEAVGPSTDVFGLGAVLYELLTGGHAFPGDHADEVVRHILAGPRRKPSEDRRDVPPEVDAIVLRALSPDERYPDASALAADLAARYDPAVGNPLAIAAVVRGVLGSAKGS